MSLVKHPEAIRLAMLGMVDNNGHPYSWSAIINGDYDLEMMSRCPYPVIPKYLAAAPREAIGIPGAKVTHIWCDDPADARAVAAASRIPNVVDDPIDVIGRVDAVVIPTDKGYEHVRRARPFIEAGLPVFIDKPMVDSEADLLQFVAWHAQGKAILSSSCMRYAREFAEIRSRLSEIGTLRAITVSMCKSWERYGIHALEAVYPFLSPGGWRNVVNTGDERSNVVHIGHESGVDVVVLTIDDLFGAMGCLTVYGTTSSLSARFEGFFHAFKSQLVEFINYLRTGRPPFAFEQTVELMKLVIGGIRSREQGARRIPLSEIGG